MLLLLKNLLFTVLVPGSVGVYLPMLIAGDTPAAPGMGALLAFPIFGLGAAIYAWCVWDFATFGRGTPAPIDAPVKLVVRGLYHYVRNPMYVGVLTVLLGWVLVFQTGTMLLYAVVVGSLFHGFVLFYEEPTLQRLFGAEYDEYCSRVGRWIPRRR